MLKLEHAMRLSIESDPLMRRLRDAGHSVPYGLDDAQGVEKLLAEVQRACGAELNGTISGATPIAEFNIASRRVQPGELFIALPGAIAFVVSGWGDMRLPAGSLGYVSLVGFACIAPTTVLCAPLGAKIAHSFSADKLKVLFGLFLAVAAVRMFWRALA